MFRAELTLPNRLLPGLKAKLTDLNPMLVSVGYYVQARWMKDWFATGGQGSWPAVPRGGEPLKDTGTLSKSFSSSFGMDRKSVLVGTSVKYARAHNEGMTIKAKDKYLWVPGGPYLAIPLPGLSVSQRRIGPRAFPNSFVAKSRNGNWMVFETMLSKKGKRAGKAQRGKSKFASRWEPGTTSAETEDVIRPLFVLKKQVTLKKRQFIGWDLGSPPLSQKILVPIRRYFGLSGGE